MLQVKPLRDYIFVQILDKEYATHGGIVLPHKKDHPKARKGKVVSIGTGKRDDKGNLIPFDVQIGDTVLIGKYMGVALKVDDEELVRVTNDDILAVINGREAQASSFFLKE